MNDELQMDERGVDRVSQCILYYTMLCEQYNTIFQLQPYLRDLLSLLSKIPNVTQESLPKTFTMKWSVTQSLWWWWWWLTIVSIVHILSLLTHRLATFANMKASDRLSDVGAMFLPAYMYSPCWRRTRHSWSLNSAVHTMHSMSSYDTNTHTVSLWKYGLG